LKNCLPSSRKFSILATTGSKAAPFEDTVKVKAMASTFLFFPLLLAATNPIFAQQSPAHVQRVDSTAMLSGDNDTRERLEQDMAKRANLARQAALRNDTEKLLKLAGELQEYVNKSNENILSLDVLKKAEEIEKLAHSVKDKMKGPN
jgi:hypothetical protein